MAAILDLVNKSCTYVAELYFIGFVDPANIILGTKSIFLAGLEIEISQKLDVLTGHGGHFEKRIFFIVWTLLERATRSNIFFSYKNLPNKIKKPNMPDLATKFCFRPLLRFGLRTKCHEHVVHVYIRFHLFSHGCHISLALTCLSYFTCIHMDIRFHLHS